LEKGQCIQLGWFDACVYGKISTVTSQTKRARSYGGFVKAARDKMSEFSRVAEADKQIAYVGEYVYLPYPHMDHDDGRGKIPFRSYSSLFSRGSPFMPREKFTARMVVTLFEFKPRTFMDFKVIRNYVDVSLPNFLIDLAKYDPKLYAAAINLEPRIDELMVASIPKQFKISELGGYIGNVKINGQIYYYYGNTRRVECKLKLPEFPTDEKVTVKFTPRPDTLCTVIDRKDAIKLWNARKR
jgi:hypothetical protein